MIHDNLEMIITKASGEQVKYTGVSGESAEELSSLLHPDYWKEIPVGKMRRFNDGINILIRFSENVMLIRHNGSRNFVLIRP